MEIVIGIIIGLAIGFFVGKLMQAKSAGEEKTQLVAKAQVLAANIEQIKLHHAFEVQSMKSQMENERLYAAKLRAESDQQWAQKLESLKQEMQRMTIEQQKVEEWCALFVCIVKCRRVKYLQESPMMFGVMS